MSYKIIGDSCSDLTEEMKKDPIFSYVPLTLIVGDHEEMDDENFNQKAFLERMKNSSLPAKTACPSPEAYAQAIFEAGTDEVYVVTLSEHLSGSYQSAVLGLNLFHEEHPDSKVKAAVFGSDSASAGQTNILLTIRRFKEEGLGFEETCEKTKEYINEMKTFFVLESLDELQKNGRLSTVKALLAFALNIKPVMAGKHGIIVKAGQERGMNKALKKMCALAVESVGGAENCRGRLLTITHVNNPERAQFVKSEFEKLAHFRDIVITTAQGVATIYASDGGIVVAL